MIAVALVALTIVGVQEFSRLRKFSAGYALRVKKHAFGEGLYRPIVREYDAEADGLVDEARKVESRLKQVIATGIKPEYNLKGERGVEVELLRSGIPQAVAARDESTFRSLNWTIQSLRLSEKRTRAFASQFRPFAEHHASMKRKYECAARYPWLVVKPDPPVPSIKFIDHDFRVHSCPTTEDQSSTPRAMLFS